MYHTLVARSCASTLADCFAVLLVWVGLDGGVCVVLFCAVLCCAADYTTPDFSLLTNSSQPNGAQTWRTTCYDPSSVTNIQITGGFRSRTSITFTNDFNIAVTLQMYMGTSHHEALNT